jgi:signal transduction histidine kinase
LVSKNISILVIEDSEDDRALIALELRIANFSSHLTFIESEEELKKALQKNIFQIVLCDYNLPGFNAFSALEIVKESGLDIPFIIVSGYVSEDDAIKAMKLGAADFIMKDNLTKLPVIIDRELIEANTRKTKRDAEKSLHQSQASLQAIIDNSPAMFFLLDEKGELKLCNKSFQQVFGKEKYNKNSSANTKTLSKAVEDIREKVLLISSTITEEVVIPNLDSIFEMSCFLISDGDFEKGHVGVSLNNITRQKREQAQVAQLQKMEAMGKLTGGVAHDFNNLLTIIQGNAELLESEVEGVNAKFVGAILRAAKNGNELTRQLLSFARTTAVNVSNANINDLIASMLKLIGRTLGSGVVITFSPSKDSWLSFVDASQLENVILNMLINARDSMEGEGNIYIETSTETINVAPRDAIMPAPPGDYVHISIKDTGSGIPDDVLACVFEPFFTTKEVDQGTGLGLAMIFGFVQQSNGFITVDSEPDKGTTFGLYLPRTTKVDNEEEVKTTKLISERIKGNILVVEDDKDVLDVIVDVLSRVGHTITSVSVGRDAVKALKGATQFDLIISDIVLPGGMSGQDIMKEAIKLQPKAKNLFISGHTKNLDLSADEMGREIPLLAKPFSMTQLIEEIDTLLGDQ